MKTTTTTTAPDFAGWCRIPGRPWQRLCVAVLFDDALAELLRAAGTAAGGRAGGGRTTRT
jgi:hypothetical protein